MKKAKFSKNGHPGKWLYVTLCIGVVAISAATVAGYKNAMNSLTDSLVNEEPAPSVDEIDYSEVDTILKDIEKQQAEANAQVTQDIQSDLEAVFYQQAVYMPVSNGDVVGEFSFGELVKSSTGVWRTHDGVDFKADLGDPVKSMTSGTVTDVYNDQLWGNCIAIDHGDAITAYYCGLTADAVVAVGDKVDAGQVIGYVGETEIESDMEPHLHFALKLADRWIDPISYIEPYK